MRKVLIGAFIACGMGALFLSTRFFPARQAASYRWDVSTVGMDPATQRPISDVRLRTATTEYYAGQFDGDCHVLESKELLPHESSGLVCTSDAGAIEIGVFHSEHGTYQQALNRAGANNERDLFSSRFILVLNRNDWEE